MLANIFGVRPDKNDSPAKILGNALVAALGLFCFGFGVHLTIQANVGASPWDVLALGVAKTAGILYGNASIAISLTILLIDVALREQIGIGMFLDAVIVGKTVDLFNWLGWVPLSQDIWLSVALIVAGLVVESFSLFLYMQAGLGCGPRDTLLVGCSRRLPKVPIGAISIATLCLATLIGWLLGGPVGAGTLACALLIGPSMQLAFKICRFDPVDVRHQNILESARVLAGKGRG